MASSKETKQELMSCPICLEKYNVPKRLPCLHSFCKDCLQYFIDKAFATERNKTGITCPVCRLFVTKPDTCSTNDWADQLPGNHLLKNLIELEELQIKEKNCNACLRENESERAHLWCLNCTEALCEICVRSHRRNKATCSHKLVEINEIASTGATFQAAELYCHDHPGKLMEAYCFDHSAVCCTFCVMFKHRKCDNVGDIADAAGKVKNSDEVEQLKASIENMIQHLKKIVDNRDKNARNLLISISKMKNNVVESYDSIIQHFERLKSATLDEISATEKGLIPDLQSESDDIKGKILALENDLQVLETSLKHSCPADFLLTMHSLSEQIVILEKSTKDFGSLSIQKSETDIPSYQPSSYSIKRHVDMLATQPELINSIDFTGQVEGVAVLNDDRILISNSESLVLLTAGHTAISTLSIPGSPYKIKMLTDIEGAVAVHNTCLLFFKVNGETITETTRLQVPVLEDFIYHRKNYYVGTGSENKIIVYDDSLRYVRDIVVMGCVRGMASRDDTTLCYTTGDTLYCVTLQGVTVFQYTHDKLNYTEGVTVDDVGNIYVCGHHSKNLHQLNHDGQLQRIIIDDMPALPNCISINRQYTLIAVGCYRKLLLYGLK